MKMMIKSMLRDKHRQDWNMICNLWLGKWNFANADWVVRVHAVSKNECISRKHEKEEKMG
jgi:uncharacterized protein YjaZ